MTGSDRFEDRPGDPDRTLRCEEARVLLMGYLDGELEAEQRVRLEDHLAVCVACRREERSFRKLGELADGLGGKGEIHVDTDSAWDTIYRRIERATGWVLLSIGLLLLLGFGTYELFDDFLFDPEVPAILRFGVGTLGAGVLVMLVSIARERWLAYRSERYREVER